MKARLANILQKAITDPLAGLVLLLGCLAVILVFAGIVVYALYQRREVKAGLKIPGATFFFRATGGVDGPHKKPNRLK